jgi:hypothetical protein
MIVLKLLYVAGGFLFLISSVAHVYVRIRLRPKDDCHWDDSCCEFEEQHQDYARYARWLRITLGGAALGVLLLFAVFVF